MPSKNGFGIAAILVALFGLLDIDVDTSQMEEVVGAGLLLYGFVQMIWNQLNRPDTKLFLFKR